MVRRSPVAVVAALAVLLAGCGVGAEAVVRDPVIETISPARAGEVLADPPAGLVVLDVRTPEEFAAARLPGAVNLDFHAASFRSDLAALDLGVPYLLYCNSGNRSAEAREMMRSLGFREVHEIAGGIVAWAEAGLPLELP